MIEAKIEIYDLKNLGGNLAAIHYNLAIQPLAVYPVRLHAIPSMGDKLEIDAYKTIAAEISHKIVCNPNNNELSQQSVIIKCTLI